MDRGDRICFLDSQNVEADIRVAKILIGTNTSERSLHPVLNIQMISVIHSVHFISFILDVNIHHGYYRYIKSVIEVIMNEVLQGDRLCTPYDALSYGGNSPKANRCTAIGGAAKCVSNLIVQNTDQVGEGGHD